MKKFLYYLIQWTWGLPMSLIGLFVFLICKICHCRHYWYRNAICIVLPNNFDGLELGMFFIRGKWSTGVCVHEYGHSIQNLWWGPLFLFVIFLPSACWYWYRRLYMKLRFPHTRKPLPPYDTPWFERQATELGRKANKNMWSWL